MKRFNILLASLALSVFALSPAGAMADDELDVTMEVLDSVANIDGDVIVMQGPEDDGFAGADDEGDEHDGGDVAERDRESDEGMNDASSLEDDFVADVFDDDFAHDEDFTSDDDEEHSEDESGFDEGDDVDNDVPDEEPMDDEEPFNGQESDAASDDDMVDDLADNDMVDDVADGDSADGEVTDGV